MAKERTAVNRSTVAKKAAKNRAIKKIIREEPA